MGQKELKGKKGTKETKTYPSSLNSSYFSPFEGFLEEKISKENENKTKKSKKKSGTKMTKR